MGEVEDKDKYSRDNLGRFATDREPNVGKLTVRVPLSLQQKIKGIAGDDLAAWVRLAILEKLEKLEGDRP